MGDGVENLPVRSKQALVLVVPLLALLGLGVRLVVSQVEDARDADRTHALATWSIQANELVTALQQERNFVAGWVGSGYRIWERETIAARDAVDRTHAALTAAVAGLPDDSRLRTAIDAAQRQMLELPQVRAAIDARGLAPGEGTDVYTRGVQAWLAVKAAQVGVGSQDPDVVRTEGTLTALSNIKEQAAQQRGTLALLVILRQATGTNEAAMRASAGAEAAWVSQFRGTATPEQANLYDALVGPVDATVSTLRDRALGQVTAGQPIDVTPDDWINASSLKIDQIRLVERQVTVDLETTSQTLATDAQRRAWLVGVAAAVVILLTVGISLYVASRLVRQLRGLRDAAVDIAERRLPEVIEALAQRQPVDPDEGDRARPTATRDEIGEVTDALFDVYGTAVRGSVEVATHRSVRSSVTGLAQRSQTLIHRQLLLISTLERDLQDPAMLDRLIRLDHLATRMRRHAEGLIALSGGVPSRRYRRAVPLLDVLRAAIAEVEDYARVHPAVTADVAVVGTAVGDVIHLLAELVENATQFSPGQAAVDITGTSAGGDLVIEVRDRGIGIPTAQLAELNAKLSDPPPFDPAAEGGLGLFVVGVLAARHTITVRLDPSSDGGITAAVRLPAALIAADDDSAPAPPPEAADDLAADDLAADLVADEDDPLDTAAVLDRVPALATAPGREPAPDPGQAPAGEQDSAEAAAGPALATVGVGDALYRRARPGLGGHGPSPAQGPPADSAPGPGPSPTGDDEPDLADGLPQRRRGAHLAAQLRGGPPPAPRSPATGAARPRDPDAARGLIDDFRGGFDRGLTDEGTSQ
ncbi:sensor histidine kinase [Frankia nepalensis]|uniref:histidine kinase n=1 Tax=Frankia nepalensis TaxID=1836974 RepID=A0A937RUJ3_9ACTN|nr:sensor histidine kinase [Frankia nepalensis]MBL7514590.1 nitrate- and nitrite sensing domain-containing protein [Frankia nepalensis]MBL7633083.1 nitrate- and nitrite sensing domain-containing protein [Frankia nepalensis]